MLTNILLLLFYLNPEFKVLQHLSNVHIAKAAIIIKEIVFHAVKEIKA